MVLDWIRFIFLPLKALLHDLQNTTAVLKRANLSSKYQQNSNQEPIYEPQKATVSTMAGSTSATRVHHGLQDLEQLLDDYTAQRGRQAAVGRPTVESLLGELDNAVPNGEDRPSTTTKDLDNVMTSLSEFKVSSSSRTNMNGDASYARPVRSQRLMDNNVGDGSRLDSMLGSLQSDLSKHGITTIPKGDCAACNKSIVGQVVIALGKMWHPEHFSCSHCGEELGHRNFFERSGRAYCEGDYHNLFSPRCAYCNGPIKDKCVTAMEKTWHPEHFICAHCGKEFGDEGFHEKEGRPYCRRDFFSSFAPRCRGCQKPITNNYITALNSQWHPECFVCQAYETAFEDWKHGSG